MALLFIAASYYEPPVKPIDHNCGYSNISDFIQNERVNIEWYTAGQDRLEKITTLEGQVFYAKNGEWTEEVVYQDFVDKFHKTQQEMGELICSLGGKDIMDFFQKNRWNRCAPAEITSIFEIIITKNEDVYSKKVENKMMIDMPRITCTYRLNNNLIEAAKFDAIEKEYEQYLQQNEINEKRIEELAGSEIFAFGKTLKKGSHIQAQETKHRLYSESTNVPEKAPEQGTKRRLDLDGFIEAIKKRKRSD